MNILLVGDMVGGPGRRVFAQTVARLKAAGEADWVIVNAENAAGGKGLSPQIAEELFKAGADVLTLGDHTWDQREIGPYLATEPRVIRPANFAPGCPGRGWVTRPTPWGDITVVSVVGRVFMRPYECPFRAADAILAREAATPGRMVFVDVHAEATSEKIALGRYLDGRVTAVFGTHTHVQTSDEGLLPKGTAYITDLGMTGPKDSVLGREVEPVLANFLTGMPAKFELATRDVKLEGAIVTVDRASGRATAIRRVREALAL